MSEKQPLELPADFDEAVHMPATETDTGVYHVSRAAAALARKLVANGTELDLERAAPVLEAVLSCQERNDEDPHVGNFYWMAEDSVVADLNAVEFVLAQLIPLLQEFSDRVRTMAAETSLYDRLVAAVHLGLKEVVRLDVHVGYTNIAVFDCYNSMVGAEVLGDRDLFLRGRKKFERWIGLTLHGGHPLEYNSPTYTALTLGILEELAARTGDTDTAVLAETMASRLALSIGLRLHSPTGRWAGPHGRAYHPAVSSGVTPREVEAIEQVRTGRYSWMSGLSPESMQIEESVSPEQSMTMTTFLSASFSLGTSSVPFMEQSNSLIAYYRQKPPADAGVFYTRYLKSDKWYGDFYHSTDRSNSRNLLEQARPFAVQEGGAAIIAYAPSSLESVSGAKAVCVWNDTTEVDELLVDGRPVSELPVSVPGDALVGVAAGEVYFAVRPLSLQPLGPGAGVELTERDGHLLLEFVQYRGPEKEFWELRWPGGFYKGRPLTAFFVEIAERSEHPDLHHFLDFVNSGIFDVTDDPPKTYDGSATRLWRAEYRRDDLLLGLEIDLNSWQLRRRWNGAGEKGYPQLESPVAKQRQSGAVEVEDGRLSSEKGPLWLYGDRANETWFGGFCFPPGENARVILETPDGRVEIPGARAGWIRRQNGKVSVRVVDLKGDISVEGGEPADAGGST